MGRRPDPPTLEEVWAWVEKTCAAQGLEPKITDRGVLRRVAEILAAASSRPPNRRKPRRVEEVPAPDGRTDGSGVQDGGHDRLLA